MRNTLQRVLSALSFYETCEEHEEQFELGDGSMKDSQPMVLRGVQIGQTNPHERWDTYYIGILKYEKKYECWGTKARISKEFYPTFSDAQTALMRGTYTKVHVVGADARAYTIGDE